MKTMILGAIITTLIAGSSGFMVVVHNHGQKLPIINKTELARHDDMYTVSREIRRLDNLCHDLESKIERKRSDLLRVELNPIQDARIIELRTRLQQEIQDYLRKLEQEQQRLREEESKESALRTRTATA